MGVKLYRELYRVDGIIAEFEAKLLKSSKRVKRDLRKILVEYSEALQNL